MKDVLILLGAVVLGVTLALSLLRRRARRRDIPALVFLLKEARPLADWQVRQAAARALGVELVISRERGPNTVVALAAEKVQRDLPPNAGMTYLIDTGKRLFLLNAVSRPYMDDPGQFVERIADPSLRQAVIAHRAWISADLFGDPASRSERHEVYAALGRLLASFAGEDCLALYCPELEQCKEFAPEIVGKLASGDPLSLFEGPNVRRS